MPEIIQQWQFLGQVQPKLLEDKVLKCCKEVGITSLQSYLTWAGIEKEPGKIDFSNYDQLVEKLKKHNLKWVPFLILGPEYATPKWFQESEESVFFKCLEHQKESKIQSIWNPYLPEYLERFLKLVSEHYLESGVLESVALGISGNWGEAIYPATGGFLTRFHTHYGWWAGDEYACQKYRELKGRDFPVLVKNQQKGLIRFLTVIIGKMPNFLKGWLKIFLKIRQRKFLFIQNADYQPKELKTASQREDWLNFINWYLDSMVRWAEFWLKTARNYFPETKIYLVTGGTGQPVLGADFVQQVKVAKKYNAGIRITNQTNDYAQSFILTRLVATASKFYNTYFVTEEAAVLQTPEGVVMRIFDAITSGAAGLYCKNIISIGGDPCLKKNLPIGKLTKGVESLTKNLPYFTLEKPIIKTAVFFPNSSIAFKPDLLTSLYNQGAKLRDILDFDLVDEAMIKDGALKEYQFLLVLEGEIPEGELSERVKNWTEKGAEKGAKLLLHPSKDDLEILSKKADNIDSEYDGVYATRFVDKIIYYNSTNLKIKKKVDFLNKVIEIEANSITSIPLIS